jgi:hypothetical protein
MRVDNVKIHHSLDMILGDLFFAIDGGVPSGVLLFISEVLTPLTETPRV